MYSLLASDRGWSLFNKVCDASLNRYAFLASFLTRKKKLFQNCSFIFILIWLKPMSQKVVDLWFFKTFQFFDFVQQLIFGWKGRRAVRKVKTFWSLCFQIRATVYSVFVPTTSSQYEDEGSQCLNIRYGWCIFYIRWIWILGMVDVFFIHDEKASQILPLQMFQPQRALFKVSIILRMFLVNVDPGLAQSAPVFWHTCSYIFSAYMLTFFDPCW